MAGEPKRMTHRFLDSQQMTKKPHLWVWKERCCFATLVRLELLTTFSFTRETRKWDVARLWIQGLVAMSGAKPLGTELLCFCRLGLASPLSATASGFGSLPMIAAATAGSSL